MKAIQIIRPGEVKITEMEPPQPGPGEVLLRITYVGFCGSDLSTYLGKNPLVTYPRIPGHEIAGIIETTGKEVPPRFRKGMKATVIPYTSCGHCAACRNGRPNACEHNQTLGVQRDGAMTEYITVPWEKLLTVPELTEEELALVEPLTVGFHATARGEVKKGDTVLVLGCGMIGTGAIISATRRGAVVIAADIDDTKLELARTLGARHTINTQKEELHSTLQDLLHGEAPDVVVEAAGNPITYRAATEEVAFTGRVVCIGYTPSEVSFATSLWVKKELDIRGSRNALPEDFEEVIATLKQHLFPPGNLISRIVTPEESPRAFADWAENPGRILKILLHF